MTTYDVLLFDIDGTLADRDTHALLDGVEEWFKEHAGKQSIALITNQGGVGLRRWMTDDQFGDPEKFPTEEQVCDHINAVNDQLPGGPYAVWVCYAYQSKKTGKWAPIPADRGYDTKWFPFNRKPFPGMIFQAMSALGSTNALFIGDSEEDQLAATNARIDFAFAAKFFGRESKND